MNCENLGSNVAKKMPGSVADDPSWRTSAADFLHPKQGGVGSPQEADLQHEELQWYREQHEQHHEAGDWQQPPTRSALDRAKKRAADPCWQDRERKRQREKRFRRGAGNLLTIGDPEASIPPEYQRRQPSQPARAPPTTVLPPPPPAVQTPPRPPAVAVLPPPRPPAAAVIPPPSPPAAVCPAAFAQQVVGPQINLTVNMFGDSSNSGSTAMALPQQLLALPQQLLGMQNSLSSGTQLAQQPPPRAKKMPPRR